MRKSKSEFGCVHYKEPLETNFGLLTLAIIMLTSGVTILLTSGIICIEIVYECISGRMRIDTLIFLGVGSVFVGMILFIIFLSLILFPLHMIKDVYHEFCLDKSKDISVKYTLKKIKVGWDKVILRYMKESKQLLLTIEVGNGHQDINKFYEIGNKEFENLVCLANLHNIEIKGYSTL